MTKVGATIQYLQTCQRARAAGFPVSTTTDPEWLLDVAICRRAGWVEDRHSFEIARPTRDGAMPRKANGDSQRLISQLARRINTPRLRVHRSELGSWGKYLERRLPDRFAQRWDE